MRTEVSLHLHISSRISSEQKMRLNVSKQNTTWQTKRSISWLAELSYIFLPRVVSRPWLRLDTVQTCYMPGSWMSVFACCCFFLFALFACFFIPFYLRTSLNHRRSPQNLRKYARMTREQRMRNDPWQTRQLLLESCCLTACSVYVCW